MVSELDSYAGVYEGANLYDFDNEIIMNWYPQRVLHLCKDRSFALELGLGHGISTAIFSKHFDRHVVIEASSLVIENFNSRYPACSAEIVETYFEDFDTKDRFDVIVFGFVLEHVQDPIRLLRRFKTFLAKPKGRMFVTVPNAEVMNRRLGHIMGILPDLKELSSHDVRCGHKRYYDIKQLKMDVEQAGLLLMGLEGVYLKPFTTQQLKNMDLDESVLNALCVLGIEYPELCCAVLAQIGEGGE